MTAPANTLNTPNKTWSWRIGVIGLIGVLLAIAVAAIALTLARYDIIGKLTGFIWFMGTQTAAMVCGAIGLIALIIGLVKKSGPKWPAMLAILLAVGLAALTYVTVMMPGQSAPALHDITTDVDDPPQFTTLDLREDNLVPFSSMEEWRAAHRQGYPDLGPVIVDQPPAQVLAQARALAEDRGWEIASFDMEAGHLEATAFAGYIRFRDDVIIEVTPIEDGSTRVDMRSLSRVGLSDLGYNAKRIEAFLSDLASG